MIDADVARVLLEHGVLGALVLGQFGVIAWLIVRLTTRVNGQARRIDRIEATVVKLGKSEEK